MGVDAAAAEHFGPYVVYERLGVGGMATVHRALERDGTGRERIVALKRLLPHLAEDASFIKAFVREAKLASMLAHTNIVEIYELGRVGPEYFISMEYIDGHDVRRVLRHARKVTGPPPIHVTVGLMLQLCDALAYAHSRSDTDGRPLGLVHRDVSPSNLLVTTAGHLKVIDFGIAKAQSSQLRTQTGRVKGKLAYMAPEAVTSGRELDARSDIWAAGVILHELLTARPLFASKNEYQTLIKVQRGDIALPSATNQSCPKELDAIVTKALARDPDQRFSGADKMRADLDDLRRRYKLQSSVRDVAGWLEWAFSLEPLPGASVSLDAIAVSPVRASSPQISISRSRDDDDAVELVWGTGGIDKSAPVLLSDVPDVSTKHLSGRAMRSDDSADDSDDDIPTPQPTHGQPTRAPAPRTTPPPPPRPRASRPPPMDAGESSDATDQLALYGPHDLDRAETAIKTDPDGRAISITDPDARAAPTTDPVASPLADADDAAATIISMSNPVDTPAGTLVMVRPSTVPPPPAPVVRFTTTSPPPFGDRPIAEAGGLEPLRPPPQTKPGVHPASAYVIAPRARTATASPTTIGAAIVARNQPSRRGWLMVIGLVVLGGAATVVTLVMTTGADHVTTVKHDEPRVPVHETGIVKFVTEPTDSEIKIEGESHAGSPWSTAVPSGIHQIEIRHAGYKTWLTSIELSPKETQTFHVVLEPLAAAATPDATLSISTNPPGLDVVIDGALQPKRTPFKTTDLKAGSHVIAIRRGGVEIWHQNIKAEPMSDYELNPSFAVARQPVAIPRTPRPAIGSDQPAPAPIDVDVVDPPAMEVDAGAAGAAPSKIDDPPAAPVDAAVIAPARVPAVPTGPLTVAPSAVVKLSGDPPDLAKLPATDLPPVVAAKVCIDTLGAVSSVDVVNKIDRQVTATLIAALQTWRYAPYKRAGVAQSACFVVTLRSK